ncbi:MAG: hypothetical protein UR28_C0031G0008 [Candidatus Peregrinibacteria bacterium GW2011_GWF2_33_10]|nr:MAG: hypothetical protein UR28_C0031G0008 [Candidatus Peregrinibacteria bacterium GW2011_GWF2_33_10]OGJ44640.1 MAG: hypothetical protein A2263_00150 [Candidatus Peregrinibacteria bacterium RIFOXYA2_FULL_33_21]OGJ46414.1 MAG: hypothetical protein A2272_06595 [Candidatus Peregrinibacteria bacterium RIFOXYA12_FULL_33_12]OGJ50275.1 MAG: hypothetical protein A2307_01795 [Candidatus Peregrinibacteria bacterium RIFOXYB2_FULL_33_20]
MRNSPNSEYRELKRITKAMLWGFRDCTKRRTTKAYLALMEKVATPFNELPKNSEKTNYGTAISPSTAGKVILDYRRTIAYVIGAKRLVERAQKVVAGRPVVYASMGTGPYDPGVFPLTTMFSSKQLQIIAVDLHQANLDSLEKAANNLGVIDYFVDFILADATTLQFITKPDVASTETMCPALTEEPQVAIYNNTKKQILIPGAMIPEEVCISAFFVVRDSAYKETYKFPLGEVLRLNSNSPDCLEVNKGFEIPKEFYRKISWMCQPKISIRLRTAITVFGGIIILPNKSSITDDIDVEFNVCNKPSTITIQYVLGASYRDIKVIGDQRDLQKESRIRIGS